MSTKTVDWRSCDCGLKRAFSSRQDAEKAMGRAQAKRTRRADVRGTRRGLKVEGRVYECDFGGWHLTSMSRRAYEELYA
ncbi:hypothetical protein SEA_BROPLEASE_58 [Streptomyces phage BroPlease]|nr:hypothetical protein SEA_BROPLEASE_58 [Streptomyces phage BroPlease]USH44977.1 hypothetical protein SEA_GREENWEASEL_60 [Streptomyces phage GreenWeasel]